MKTFEDFDIKGLDLSRGGNQKVFCPKCHDDRKDKSDKSLSVEVTEGYGKCHYCDWKFSLFTKEYVKTYQRPPEPPKIEVGVKTMEWFRRRGISEKTVSKFKINEVLQWMPEKDNHKAGERNCICFNYYRDNRLINIKYRDGLKNFRLFKDAELIFYNLDSIKGWAECIICEGEVDAMSFHEAGFYNVVSVPNGATAGGKLEYLNNCIDWFTDMKKIVIAADGDEKGQLLSEELVRRLGSERCHIVKYPEGFKDANEVLIAFGADGVKQLVTSAEPTPVEGIFMIDKNDEEVNNVYLHGYPTAAGIGYSDLDNHIKFVRGHFTLVTGVPNSGKSQWLDQVAVRLAIRNKWKFGVFSPENQPISHHVIKLVEIFVGKPLWRYDNTEVMNPLAKDLSMDILGEHFFFMKVKEIDVTIDGLLKKAREMVLRFGTDAFVFDPYNCIEHNIPHGQSETNYISKVLDKFSNFAKKYNVHIFLVAHPTKMQKRNDGSYEIPTPYDVAGSANFFNKPDNCISVYRNLDDTVEIHIQKIRFKWVGKRGIIPMKYDVATGRYCEPTRDFKSELLWLRDHAEQTAPVEELVSDTPF